MIERIGKDIIVNGDVLPGADYYDGIDDTDDGPVIDEIISSIHPKAVERTVDRHDEQHTVSALGQGVLFLIDKDDIRPKSIEASVEQHPSVQNLAPQELSAAAKRIIQAYYDDLEDMKRYKKHINASAATRKAFILYARTLTELSTYDREYIVETLGYGKDALHKERAVPITESEQSRPRDWRELQANDDTLTRE